MLLIIILNNIIFLADMEFVTVLITVSLDQIPNLCWGFRVMKSPYTCDYKKMLITEMSKDFG